MNPTDEGFEAFFHESYGDVVRFAARRVGPHAAEDVAAEAFAIAWRRREDLPKRISERRPWIFGVTRNLLLAQSRSHNRAVLPVLDEIPDRTAGSSYEESVVELDALQTAWSFLDDAQREVLALTAWDQLRSHEAGAVLGISAGAYRIRLTRARSALKQLIQGADGVDRQRSATTQLRSIR